MTRDTPPILPGLLPEKDQFEITTGALLLRNFAGDIAIDLIDAIPAVTEAAPFRHLVTPGGQTMSVAMTNCGPLGWVSDRRGYRYAPLDPESGTPWPPMPPLFRDLAIRAAEAAGFPGFAPDCCLINLYRPGARMSLHQDRDEKNLLAPIVSVSLGLPAVFRWSGERRTGGTRKIPLYHGDVVVWGGPARLHYHGVQPLKPGQHPLTGETRINITFREVTKK